jgi:hypothetical protein
MSWLVPALGAGFFSGVIGWLSVQPAIHRFIVSSCISYKTGSLVISFQSRKRRTINLQQVATVYSPRANLHHESTWRINWQANARLMLSMHARSFIFVTYSQLARRSGSVRAVLFHLIAQPGLLS